MTTHDWTLRKSYCRSRLKTQWGTNFMKLVSPAWLWDSFWPLRLQRPSSMIKIDSCCGFLWVSQGLGHFPTWDCPNQCHQHVLPFVWFSPGSRDSARLGAGLLQFYVVWFLQGFGNFPDAAKRLGTRTSKLLSLVGFFKEFGTESLEESAFSF